MRFKAALTTYPFVCSPYFRYADNTKFGCKPSEGDLYNIRGRIEKGVNGLDFGKKDLQVVFLRHSMLREKMGIRREMEQHENSKVEEAYHSLGFRLNG